MGTIRDIKSGGEVAEKTQSSSPKKIYAKSDVRYWEAKVFHDAYSRDGERIASADWCVRLQHSGRREAFPLGTPNKTAAAAKARDIFLCLKGGGWEEAFRRFKPSVLAPVITDATLGDLLREAGLLAGVRPRTFADYAKALRKIVADIFEIDGGREKFNAHTGGRQEWIDKIEAIKLAEITPDRVQRWKLGFVNRAGTDPVSTRRARISVNSLMQQAKALFSKKIIRFLPFKLPDPLPFKDVSFEPRQSMRFRSSIDVRKLIATARKELARGDGDKREQYKAFILGVCAGLRRSEIDRLEWDAFNFKKHLISVQPTGFIDPKSQKSAEPVSIDPQVSSIFAATKKKATGSFVIESDGHFIPNATWSHYRCQKIFDGLLAWLRAKGITAQKPIHELRKELGNAVADEHGIFAAQRTLRHADIAITSKHYADKPRNVTVGFGKLLGSKRKTPTTGDKNAGSKPH